MKRLLPMGLLLLMIGCVPMTEYVSYSPHPAFVTVPATQPAQPPVVDAYASVTDVRQPDDRQHRPLIVEVRLRLDNHSGEPVTLDLHSLDLTNGDLIRFLPAEVNSPGPITIAAAQSVIVTADFPFPDNRDFEQVDLSNLRLRWSIQIGARTAEQSVGFHRDRPRPAYYYSDPYPYGYDPYVGGVVVIHRRF